VTLNGNVKIDYLESQRHADILSLRNMDDLQPEEIKSLVDEVDELRHENAVLLGLMAGGYAYFFRQLMMGHQTAQGLSAEVCDRILIDALKRVISTQARFGYEYLPEIEAALEKMTMTVPLKPYLEKVSESL
jgi:hypothetical protein